VEAIRDAFRSYLPRSSEALERLAQNPDALNEEWGNLDATSIDYGIMERTRHILTVPCDPGWSDMGTWAAAGAAMPAVQGGRGHARSVIARDARGCTVHAPDKTVVLLGVENVVVVDTEDALLVMGANRSAQLGEVVRELSSNGDEDLI
jgi:mannose-1-phosphate guanylyltransferase